MKEPRYRITLDVTINEYLGLLWAIDGSHGDTKADKQTIRKIAKFEESFWQQHEEWRAGQFKCAGRTV